MPNHLHSSDIPNQETIAAIEDAKRGKVESYNSLEVMWTDLDEEQENEELNAIADKRLSDGQSTISLSLQDL